MCALLREIPIFLSVCELVKTKKIPPLGPHFAWPLRGSSKHKEWIRMEILTYILVHELYQSFSENENQETRDSFFLDIVNARHADEWNWGWLKTSVLLTTLVLTSVTVPWTKWRSNAVWLVSFIVYVKKGRWIFENELQIS